MKKRRLVLTGIGLSALLCPVLAGCSQVSTGSHMSKQEEKNFKGGPMPPEARKGMAEMMRQNQQKVGQAPPNTGKQ